MSFLRVLQRSPQVCAFCAARNFTTTTTASLSKVTEKTTKPPSSSEKAAASPTKLLSSCATDTVLEGVNYLKGQAPVLARPDEEYPDWLWTILKQKVLPDDGPGGKAERMKRRQDNRQRIKDRNFMSTQ